jgi:hypothetical protein
MDENDQGCPAAPLETMHKAVCRLNLHQGDFADPERATKGAFLSLALGTH